MKKKDKNTYQKFRKTQRSFFQAEKILLDAHALIPLYLFSWNQLVSPKVKGYKPNLNGLIDGKHIWLK